MATLVCVHCSTLNRVPETRLSEHPRCGHCHAPLLEPAVTDLTGTTFDRFVGHTTLPVVVDFWAPWCGPCRQMAPAFAEAANRLGARARLAKVNTESEPDLAGRHQIRSIPTLIVFKNGAEAGRTSGAMDRARLEGFLAPFLG